MKDLKQAANRIAQAAGMEAGEALALEHLVKYANSVQNDPKYDSFKNSALYFASASLLFSVNLADEMLGTLSDEDLKKIVPQIVEKVNAVIQLGETRAE